MSVTQSTSGQTPPESEVPYLPALLALTNEASEVGILHFIRAGRHHVLQAQDEG